MGGTNHHVVIEQRALRLGEKFVLCKEATVRSLATDEGYSKSTVHKDLSERLKDIDLGLYEKVRAKLDTNKEEKHLRGGEATKQKYLSLRGEH